MSILIATLGLLSMPLGQWFYKQFSFRQQREQRFAETAQHYAYMDRLYKKHIALTFLVNMTSQLPLAIFTIMMVMGVYSSNFANYLALTMGLSGLIGVLGFQKMRVTAQNTVSKAVHLLHALFGSEFLITSHQWQEHIKNKNTSFKDTNIENGILLQEFSPTAFFHTKFKALNVSIPTGGVYLFQAPSGSGKSTLILALLHLVQHSGDFYVIRNFKQVNIHTFERDQIDNSIVFVRLEDLSASARLMDIFADVLRLRLNKLDVQIKSRFGDVLTDLAFKGSDNLLEQEIGHLKNNEKSIFPSEMYSLLSQLHQQKTSLLQSILNNGCGENVTPDRIWCTLSDGEKSRVINVLTIEKALVSPEAVLVIFDEPLVHLDEENIKRQLDEISRLQSLKKVSLMIISHLHIEALVNTLDNVQTESFLLNKIPYINVSNLVMDHPSRQIAP